MNQPFPNTAPGAPADNGPRVRTWLAEPTPSRLRLPAGACDSHVHVIGPLERFPVGPQHNALPEDATAQDLFALHRRYGIERCVIVQSAVHGRDNRVTEDAIRAAQGRYLGVGLVAPDVADAELARLAAAGMRGVRFSFMRHLAAGAPPAEVVALTPRLAAHGMHLQVHFEADLVHELGAVFARSAVPVVIDHMGRVDARLGPEHAHFQGLVKLLGNPLFRVKVSGIDRVDAHAAQLPPAERYARGVVLARLLVERFPERCVWGSDWPHPNHTHVPDDGVLFDALEAIMPDRRHLEQVLVHNPQALYRFPV